MLLTGLPVAYSQDNNCVLAQAGIRNAEKKKSKHHYQNLSQLTIEFRCHFIDFSVSHRDFRRSYFLCLFVSDLFFLFSNRRNTL